MVKKKGSPVLAGRASRPSFPHVLQNGAFGNPDLELEEFAPYSRPFQNGGQSPTE